MEEVLRVLVAVIMVAALSSTWLLAVVHTVRSEPLARPVTRKRKTDVVLKA